MQLNSNPHLYLNTHLNGAAMPNEPVDTFADPFFLSTPPAPSTQQQIQQFNQFSYNHFAREEQSSLFVPPSPPSSLSPTLSIVGTTYNQSAKFGHPFLPEKQYKCTFPNCTKSYTRKYNLLSHTLSTHSQVRPYTCTLPNCNASFSRPHDLKRHQRSLHSEYRPFICTGQPGIGGGCGMKFARSDALKRHLDRDLGRRQRGGKGCGELKAASEKINEGFSAATTPNQSSTFVPVLRSLTVSELLN